MDRNEFDGVNAFTYISLCVAAQRLLRLLRLAKQGSFGAHKGIFITTSRLRRRPAALPPESATGTFCDTPLKLPLNFKPILKLKTALAVKLSIESPSSQTPTELASNRL
ncbi:MAG: hypothetical protein K0Q85_1258 [Caproiciproducens sp.]|nr:hypothetical protein [Caproiciproducens sp.]